MNLKLNIYKSDYSIHQIILLLHKKYNKKVKIQNYKQN